LGKSLGEFCENSKIGRDPGMDKKTCRILLKPGWLAAMGLVHMPTGLDLLARTVKNN